VSFLNFTQRFNSELYSSIKKFDLASKFFLSKSYTQSSLFVEIPFEYSVNNDFSLLFLDIICNNSSKSLFAMSNQLFFLSGTILSKGIFLKFVEFK